MKKILVIAFILLSFSQVYAGDVLFKYVGTPEQWIIIKNAFAHAYHYQTKLDDGTDNPENKAQFTNRKIKEHVENVVQSFYADETNTTRIAKIQEAKTAMQGTEVQ